MRLGNGRWEHTTYDPKRLQPLEIGLGSSATDSSVLKIKYEYGTTQNNGNVLRQLITVPTIGANTGFTATQHYQYDELNRLTGAQEVNGDTPAWQSTAPSSPFWQLKFSYDQYGNRAVDTNNTTSTLIGPNPVISTANNRILERPGEYYDYDTAGNLSMGQSGDTFAYDAENKLVQYEDGATQIGGANYYYDGDGRRVKKARPSEAIIFVYNISGQLVAEYTTSTPETNGTSYLTSDTLGSPRVITKADGSVKARHDYLPFGEELYAEVGNRTGNPGQGYDEASNPADKTRQKFTSKERDNETRLDYFGARYYGSTQGRFTSPDPVILSNGRVRNPQLWNTYAYAGNNPLKYIDPSGLERIALGDSEEQIKKDIEAKKTEGKQNEKDKSLTKEERNQRKAEIGGQLKTLETKLAGTKLVNEILKDLDKVGERNGLQLGDFSLTTNPTDDFSSVSADRMSTIMSSQAFHQGGEIYIRTDTSLGFFNAITTATDSGLRSDFLHIASGIVAHEQYHKLHPLDRTETSAYTRERDVFGKYKNYFNNSSVYQKHMRDINDAINKVP